MMVSEVENILLKSSGMAGRLLNRIEATLEPRPEGSGGGAGRESGEKLSRLGGSGVQSKIIWTVRSDLTHNF